MITTAATNKSYFIPEDLQRRGCPSYKTPFYQILTPPSTGRTMLAHNYTAMQLQHQSSTGEIKNSLSLDSIHKELEQAALLLDGSGASNILLSKLSFDCLITESDGTQSRDYIHFDLKIPSTGTAREPVFSYDMIEQIYGSKTRLYETLKHFYDLGKSMVNPGDHKHGHKPDYNPNDSKHDQYIRHTEQLLIAYLALPEASEMIRNRLRATIRASHPGAAAVKLYNTGLHMHSTKTCCSPCEYTLIGLMNDIDPSGFLHKFKSACREPSDVLRFDLPENSHFRLLVTVTANQGDADHRAQPTYRRVPVAPNTPSCPFIIDVKQTYASNKIFTTLLGNHYDRRNLPSSAVLSDKTVGISGSKATPGSSKTMAKAATTKTSELDQFTTDLSNLHV
jgi:hypothetical protein